MPDTPTPEDLAQALRGGQLRLLYQPQVTLPDRAIRAVEALLRWEHPVLGLLEPAAFLPLAEQSGLADDLLRWGMREVLLQSIVWAEDGATFRVAVNVSPTVTDSRLRRLLSIRGVDASRVVLELRDAHLRHQGAIWVELAALRAEGIRVCVDGIDLDRPFPDAWPVDEVKLDRALVQRVTADRSARAVVCDQVGALRARGLAVIALGVESAAEVDAALELDVDGVQGFAISVPLSNAALAAWRRAR